MITPTEILRRATPAVFAEHLGLTYQPTPGYIFDLVVVGSGPAGLAASVYGASEGLRTVSPGRDRRSAGRPARARGSRTTPASPTASPAETSPRRAAVQAMRLGARLNAPCEVVGLRAEAGFHVVVLARRQRDPDARGDRRLRRPLSAPGRRGPGALRGRRRLLRGDRPRGAGLRRQAGARRRRRQLRGTGRDLSRQHNCSVTIAIRREDLTQSMSQYLIERIVADPKIDLLTGVEVQALAGEDHLDEVTLRHTATGRAAGDSLLGAVLLHRRAAGDGLAV